MDICLEKQLKKAKEFVELEVYSPQEYMERKTELTEELNALLSKKESLEEDNDFDNYIHIQKAIPILKDLLDKYPTLSVVERNKILVNIIDVIFYRRDEGGRWQPELMDKFDLDIHFKI